MTPDDELDARDRRWAHECVAAILLGVPRRKFMAMAKRYFTDCLAIIKAGGLSYCRGCLDETGRNESESLIAIASLLDDRRALCSKHLKAIGIHTNGRWRDNDREVNQ